MGDQSTDVALRETTKTLKGGETEVGDEIRKDEVLEEGKGLEELAQDSEKLEEAKDTVWAKFLKFVKGEGEGVEKATKENAAKMALKILASFKDDDDLKDIVASLAKIAGYGKAPEEKAKAKGKEEEEYPYGYPAKGKVKKEDLPPEVAEKLVVLAKAQAELKDKLEKAEATAQQEKGLRLQREYLEKALGYSAVPVAREEVAEILRKADEVSEEFGGKIAAILKSADSAMRQSGVFTEIGTSFGTEGEAPVLIQKAEAKAKELKAQDPKLSDAEAFAKAYKAVSAEDKAAAADYVAERQRAVGKK